MWRYHLLTKQNERDDVVHCQSFENHHKSGYVLLGPVKRHSHIVVFLLFLAFVTTFYVFTSLSTFGYNSLIRHIESIDPASKTSYFDYLNSTHAIEEAGYLVYNPSCRIPDIPPFHDSVKNLFDKQSPISCSNLPLLTTITRRGNDHVLQFHKSRLARYKVGCCVNCCYNLITREDMNVSQIGKGLKPDDVFSYSKCVDFDKDVVFKGEEQFVRVKCWKKKGKKTVNVYTNMHAFVRMKKGIKDKIVEGTSNKTDEQRAKVSVMIIGIDSISRLNLMRTMPKTVDYLDRRGWISLKGYNKMDDNTFPNLVAILGGMNYDQLRAFYWKGGEIPMDVTPLIWKNFSRDGYITAYAEDEPEMSSFNYHKIGFVKSPTDYYLRPFMLSATRSTKIKLHAGLGICLGPARAADHIMNYLIDFATTFAGQPTFSLFWLNDFSHNDLNTPTTMDGATVSFFDKLASTGALNSTVIIFLSDHGMRFGKIRETYVGYLEERLPFIYFWLPDSFKNARSDCAENLIKNSNRLTSPFDVHMTLLDILGRKPNGTLGCPKCVSLFDQVPWNRSCSDAGITEHWCTCAEYKTLSTEAAPVRVMARFVVDEINDIVKNYTKHLDNGTFCSPLRAKRVLSIRSKIFSKASGYEEYVLLLQTVPGEALFEVTLSHEGRFKIMDTVSRINSYSAQSYCMNNAYAKKYCFCSSKRRSSPTRSKSKTNATRRHGR